MEEHIPTQLCSVAKKNIRTAPSKARVKAPTVHVGELLRSHIKERGLNQAEIARRSFMTPQTLSGMLKRSSLQLDTLIRLSLAAEHDFLADISERALSALHPGSNTVNEPQVTYSRRPGRAPIRFVIEADPDDARTLEQVTGLLNDLKRT